MEQKKVKIVGLSVNSQLGILQAVQLQFDKDAKLNIIKGGVGEGKTTLQKSLQLGTQGAKTLTDKQLYGNIDTEVQLLDGDMKIFVGCKSDKKGGLSYTLYTKDAEGKRINEPVIDGVRATPAKYLETLQTELTWKLDELTSENPTTQRKILLKLYQHEFKKLGVVFDTSAPEYKDTILYKIEQAEQERSQKDMMRKQVGGIKEDLIANGCDPERPATIPEYINIESLDSQIKEQEKQRTIEETKSTSGKDARIQEIKTRVSELTTKAVQFNSELKNKYNDAIQRSQVDVELHKNISNTFGEIENGITGLMNLNAINKVIAKELLSTIQLNIKYPQIPKIAQPEYIQFDEENKIISTTNSQLKGQEILTQLQELRKQYKTASSEQIVVDLTLFDAEILNLTTLKEQAKETNKVVKAVDSWNAWKQADDEVKELKKQYVKLLAKVDTGVEGLKIAPEENGEKLDIFLKYDGTYDPKYFNNEKKDLIKLSAYSGTQKPIICLLIQNYLLNQKPKAMRYMFIDNIPMDNKTETLLEQMGEKLDLTIFLNITGDFAQDKLKDGEILIQGGEVLWNK